MMRAFDLLEVVMVIVEDPASAIEIRRFGQSTGTGKPGHPVEVGADDRRLGGVRGSARDAGSLLTSLAASSESFLAATSSR